MQRCPRHQTEFAKDSYCPGCVASIALEETGEDQAAPIATLGNYELISELGRGGMGVVYLARQTALNRLVALKLLPSGSLAGREFIQRFRREGELAASLQHPNIVKIFEAGETDGELFYSMELITGGSLADWPDGKTYKPLHAANLLLKLTAAVEHAHQRGILHRDLKPANVLIDEDENPKVADFGLARLLDSSSDMTLGTQSFGSPAYMAPELIRDHRATSPLSDIYSLGGILYFLLTGRSPFVSASLDELLRQVKECEPAAPRVLDPSVPKDLQKICLKALDKNPAKRYASARDFGDDLQRFIRGEPVHAVPSGPMTRLARFARRAPWFAAASISLVLALIGGVGGIAWQAKIANQRADEITLQAEELRMNLYASDISAASLAIERGETPIANDILSRWEGLSSDKDPRGFEWHLLKEEARPAAYKLFGHREATITNIAVSTDGRRLAIVDQSGKVSIRPTHGERPFEFPGWSADEVAAIPQALGGGWVVGNSSGKIRWMATTAKVIAEAKGRQFSLSTRTTRAVVAETPRFHWWNTGGNATVLDWKTGVVLRQIPGDWRQAVISPDGGTVALADVLGGLKLMNIDTGATRDLPTPTPVWGLAFSADGKRLAAGSRRSAIIWTLAEEVSAPTIIPHNLTVWMTAFSGDGTKFLTASSDRRVRVWRTNALNSPPVTLAGHHSEIWCATFSPDGKSVFAGGKDGDVLGWKISAPSSREIVPHDHATAPFFSPDGRKLVTWSGNASHVLDLTKNTGPSMGAGIQALGYSKDGGSIIFADANGRMGRAPASAPEKLSLYNVTPPAGSLRHIRSCGDGRWMVRVMNDGGITLENPANGSVVHRLKGPPKGKRIAVAASEDGRYFAVCGEGDRTVTLHDLITHKVSKLGPKSSYYYISLAFSKDGKLLAGGDLAGPIQIWNVEDGRPLASLSGHSEESSIVLFAPDGRTLVSMGYHQDLKFWQISTWRELHSISLPDAAFCLAFSPDSRRLVTTLGRKKNEWLEWFPAHDPVVK